MLHDQRLTAQFRLTDAAHALRTAHPGYSLAQCLELAMIREPRDARLVMTSTDDREARGMGRDPASTEAIRAGAAEQKQTIRLYVRGSHGRVDRSKIEALLAANSLWEDRYAGVSPPALLSAAISRLEARAACGHAVIWP